MGLKIQLKLLVCAISGAAGQVFHTNPCVIAKSHLYAAPGVFYAFFLGPEARGCYRTGYADTSGVEKDRESPGGEGGRRRPPGVPHRGEVGAALAMR